ncbi:hypothetical protein E2I00_013775 [Balaenoptera physalus]|uniref:Ciliary microtubule inner protein 2C n=1 Tax=Balaenoptera physalus TaxID=9770 RepID=A0A643CI94_BALPH|nr:hypothetical protein E2I00_013775 [Balaenoptera physalus]
MQAEETCVKAWRARGAPGMYQGHVPGVTFSFGSPYGTTTLKYLQEQRNAEKSHTPFRTGGHFPASLFPNPNQMTQQHREYYQDKTGMAPRVPYFVLPVREWERYPTPTDLPPLGPKKKWHLLRVSPENLRTYQTFPSGKRVSAQERQMRDCYFEFRA